MARKKQTFYHRCFSTLLWNMPSGVSQHNQEGLKLNGTHHRLAYADDDNAMGENIDSI
jgi:ribosomal protein L6P/L9E